LVLRTFRGVEERIIKLETMMYDYSIDLKTKKTLTESELREELLSIRDLVVKEHQSLYVNELNNLINRVHLFGYRFASLDRNK